MINLYLYKYKHRGRSNNLHKLLQMLILMVFSQQLLVWLRNRQNRWLSPKINKRLFHFVLIMSFSNWARLQTLQEIKLLIRKIKTIQQPLIETWINDSSTLYLNEDSLSLDLQHQLILFQEVYNLQLQKKFVNKHLRYFKSSRKNWRVTYLLSII